jgi:hypothetical protein
MSEDRLAQAARHVWENERRIAKQAVLIERLETDGHVVPASSERRFSLNQGDVSPPFTCTV